jgi:hypothetical protein
LPLTGSDVEALPCAPADSDMLKLNTVVPASHATPFNRENI